MRPGDIVLMCVGPWHSAAILGPVAFKERTQVGSRWVFYYTQGVRGNPHLEWMGFDYSAHDLDPISLFIRYDATSTTKPKTVGTESVDIVVNYSARLRRLVPRWKSFAQKQAAQRCANRLCVYIENLMQVACAPHRLEQI